MATWFKILLAHVWCNLWLLWPTHFIRYCQVTFYDSYDRTMMIAAVSSDFHIVKVFFDRVGKCQCNVWEPSDSGGGHCILPKGHDGEHDYA